MNMGTKKGTKKKTMRIVPVEGSRKVNFTARFVMNGKEESKQFDSRADLFSWVRGAAMFNVTPTSIVRSVVQTVTVESVT